MLDRILLDQIMYSDIKIFCCFKTIACITEYFCCNGIQNYVALRNGITGTDHTELEFVSCERKR